MKKCVVKYYSITSDKIPDAKSGLRIVFISDLHNVSIGRNNETLLRKIESLEPDVVLLGGDTIVGKPGAAMDIGLRFMKDLGARYQVFAANGNHEYRLRIYPEVYGEMYRRYQQTIEAAGIILLENSSAKVFANFIPVQIHGFDLDRYYYQRLKRTVLPKETLPSLFGPLDPDAFHILLAHNPCYGDRYLDFGADLTLSGHYHGGIVRLNRNTPLIGNDFRFKPQYGYGHYERDGRHLITSAGLGEHTIPLRINNPRELVVVDVRCQKK